MTSVTLNLDSITKLTHEQFRELCRENRDVRLELTSNGELIVMPPTGWESGRRNANLTIDLGFLLNPQDRLVEIYRLGKSVEVLQSPSEVYGEDVLPGFILSLENIFVSKSLKPF
jgi:Uma2 family endonuclease